MSIIVQIQDKSLKQLFHIGKRNTDDTQQLLSLQFGLNHGCYAVSNTEGNRLYELAYFRMNEWANDDITELFNTYSSLNNSFPKIKVAYNFPHSIIAPFSIEQNEISDQLIKATYGTRVGSKVLSEKIAAWQLNNIYEVPEELHELVKNKFPGANYWHQNTLSLRNLPAGGEEGYMLIDFKTDDFSILLAQNSKLLLSQSYPYETPEDVLYYILKITQQFSLSQDELQIFLIGLIEKNSSLFDELCQYFRYINFLEAGWQTPVCEYPLHFFTSINFLARCEL